MMISVILIFALFLAPTASPASAKPTRVQLEPQGNPGDNIEVPETIELRVRCGEQPGKQNSVIPLPDGYAYVRDKIETLNQEPTRSNSGCRTVWDPQTKRLKISCQWPSHDKCARDKTTGEWSGPESELRVRVILYAKKEKKDQ